MNLYDIKGNIVKQDDRYVVEDNKELNNLVLSSTKLNPNKSTSGHFHKGQEEIYFFIEGSGTMELGDKVINVKKDDIVLIPDGVFHKVNAGDNGVYFVCVFDGKRRENS